jgi:HD-GYP domain-containing protein (c-di-GMP phosphodiesterase class II)
MCCDAYSAMTSDRSYRKAPSSETAISELRANAGTQFEPAVVDTLIAVVEGGAADRHL